MADQYGGKNISKHMGLLVCLSIMFLFTACSKQEYKPQGDPGLMETTNIGHKIISEATEPIPRIVSHLMESPRPVLSYSSMKEALPMPDRIVYYADTKEGVMIEDAGLVKEVWGYLMDACDDGVYVYSTLSSNEAISPPSWFQYYFDARYDTRHEVELVVVEGKQGIGIDFANVYFGLSDSSKEIIIPVQSKGYSWNFGMSELGGRLEDSRIKTEALLKEKGL